MQGTVMQCFKHFIANLPKDNPILKRKILDFLGIKNWDTMKSWERGANAPVGEPELRLQHLLAFLGYEVAELEVLKPLIRAAAALVAFQVLSLEEIVTLMGVNRQGVYGILKDGHGTSQAVEDRLATLVQQRGQELADKQAVLAALRASVKLTSSNGEASSLAPARPAPATTGVSGVQVADLAIYIRVMLPLAETLTSDRFTAADRARVRELAGADNVFTLSNLLAQLCGEQAREKFHPTTKKGGR